MKSLKLDDHEYVVCVLYRSFMAYWSTLLPAMLLLLVPLFFVIPLILSGWKGMVVLGVAFCVSLFLLIRVVWKIFRNYLILTNQHLIDVECEGMFRKHITKFPLHEIGGLKKGSSGFLQRMVGFGDISFTRVASNTVFVIRNIPQLSRTYAVIADVHDECLKTLRNETRISHPHFKMGESPSESEDAPTEQKAELKTEHSARVLDTKMFLTLREFKKQRGREALDQILAQIQAPENQE